MFVNVFSRSVISGAELGMKRWRIESSSDDFGVASTCWTFFAPAS